MKSGEDPKKQAKGTKSTTSLWGTLIIDTAETGEGGKSDRKA